MADLAELAIKVDVSQIDAASAALTRLAVAAERAQAAIAALGKDQQVHVQLQSVGEVSVMDIDTRAARRASRA